MQVFEEEPVEEAEPVAVSYSCDDLTVLQEEGEEGEGRERGERWQKQRKKSGIGAG